MHHNSCFCRELYLHGSCAIQSFHWKKTQARPEISRRCWQKVAEIPKRVSQTQKKKTDNSWFEIEKIWKSVLKEIGLYFLIFYIFVEMLVF